jgi:hypothetical protein
MGNVSFSISYMSLTLMISLSHSGVGEKHTSVRSSSMTAFVTTHIANQLRNHTRYRGHMPSWIGYYGLLLLRLQRL